LKRRNEAVYIRGGASDIFAELKKKERNDGDKGEHDETQGNG
jgi:hypothetical protein